MQFLALFLILCQFQVDFWNQCKKLRIIDPLHYEKVKKWRILAMEESGGSGKQKRYSEILSPVPIFKEYWFIFILSVLTQAQHSSAQRATVKHRAGTAEFRTETTEKDWDQLTSSSWSLRAIHKNTHALSSISHCQNYHHHIFNANDALIVGSQLQII